MFAGFCVQAGIRQAKALDRLAADNVRLHNLLDIGFGDVPVPDGVGVDDEVGAMLTLIETAGLIGTHFSLESALGEFLFEELLQFGLCQRIAASPRMTRRTLVSADEDVFVEFWHQATVAISVASAVPILASISASISASQMPSKSTKYPCTSTPGIAARRLAAPRCSSRS